MGVRLCECDLRGESDNRRRHGVDEVINLRLYMLGWAWSLGIGPEARFTFA